MPGRTDWTDELVRLERDRFRSLHRTRPTRIPSPRAGQESVWDYPRPPRVEREARRVRVEVDGVVLASSSAALRVLETAGPPTVYVPIRDIRGDLLHEMPGQTLCEWKGLAVYWRLELPERKVCAVAWSYPDPFEEYARLRDHLAFFPGRVDGCWLGVEVVRPQPGEFYGGWVTNEIVGPFKGEPGSETW